jgi:exopolyphosphatase/guanosine-5'-triphosphate,3'-diphosphate pyrophosphatase
MLRRVGVIDIGSNSVRLVVFDGAARSPAYFYNEKVLCGLGRELGQTGILHPEGRASAFASIRRFVALGEQMNLTVLSAVGTAAVREAKDGPDFVEEIEQSTGLKVMVATGQEEAALSAQGVLLGWPDAEGLVCDIGGSSMELARIENGQITRAETSGLGPLTLQSLPAEDRVPHIAQTIAKLREQFPEDVNRLFLVGGSWRALARLDMIRRNYPLHVLHEYRMEPQTAIETAIWASEQQPSSMSTMTDTSMQRLSLVPDAAKVLIPLIKAFVPRQVSISSYGIREGLLYAHMSDAIRKLDPLIEAAKYMESSAARFPGFGSALYKWIRPLFADKPKARRRLIRAACLLHDVTWRAHPDYRAEVCFESVTRANLGGLTHQERVFVGFALLNRYKSSGDTNVSPPSLVLLSETEKNDAAILGKAMRLGAMLSGGSLNLLRQVVLGVEDDTLVLKFQKDAAFHSGEVVEKRAASLANALNMTSRIDIDA